MNLNSLLRRLLGANVLSEGQFAALSDIADEKTISLRPEINTLLYAGVLCVLFGISMTVKEYFSHLGHMAIIASLTVAWLGSFYYCLRKVSPYRAEQVVSANVYVDYVLYFSCVVFSLNVGYIETHFHLLGDYWQLYLLGSLCVCSGLRIGLTTVLCCRWRWVRWPAILALR